MKKKLFTLLLALVAIATTAQAQVVLNETNFPDANFRAALASILGISEGDEITEAKIAATTSLDVSKPLNTPAEEKISDLTGIEHLTALTSLNCRNNQLTALDVSNNTALTVLYCHNNQLTALDVSKNTALTYLDCDDNQLTSLDVSKNTALTRLDCSWNQLTALDVSKNTALTVLYCSVNQLTALDVSKNTVLTELYCSDNQLTALDVSKNTALTYWDCNYNQLTALDVSKNTALTYLYCSRNQLTSLDVSQNTALKHLWCYSNQLTALDVSKNTALTNLDCGKNQLTSLDVSKNTALTELRCYSNQIKGEAMDALVASLPTVTRGYFIVIDTKDENEGNVCTKAQVAVAKEKGWIVIDLYWNNYEGSDDATAKLLLNAENFPDANFRKALASILGISEGNEITEAKIAATTTLDVSKSWDTPAEEKISDLTGVEHFTALKTLYCRYNQLTSLDVSKNTALTELNCFYNQLTALDVSNNTALTWLDCNNNQLTSLDVSKNTALTGLFCAVNQLTTLDVSNNTALTTLVCRYNQLTSLDVSKIIVLEQLLCDGNRLTSLDVSKNTDLWNLYCYDNQLTSLDVSKNTDLWILYCYDNQLTALDVSKNTALTELYCFSNQIKGAAMDALVASLPTVESGEFYVINTKNANEGNICTKAQVAIAKEKGWTVYDYNGSYSNRQEYEGSDDAAAKLLLNAENFPDANFRAALASILGISEGDEITAEKIAATTSLDVSKSWDTPAEEKIADLTGIEHFTALTELECDYNQLTSLDVSRNSALTTLYCNNNSLTSLDVSKNIVLTELYCNSNQLTSLDVSKNTALEGLWFDSNRLTSLDVSKNAVLTYLHCGGNQLTSLDVSKNTALIYLDCYGNKLTTLDVSKNTLLTDLRCEGSQLTMLDISKNTALTQLYCPNNKLTALDVSKNTALEYLDCFNNQLTSLDVSKNTALTELACFSNKIKGEAMDALVASLPTVESGDFFVIDTKDENEGNICTKAQVAVAKEKGWTVYDYNGSYGNRQEYEGSDPVEEDIDPVDEDDNIDFGSDMDENDDLNGNVIGDIYYNINTGNGGYNAAEGCIVVTKPTDDGTVNDLEGKDIFGEDFKSQFTGIVFKVPAGKGTIKVNAETTGNMLLKVKIGSNDPVEMELNGKLKVTFPYNVSETTYVYIYAGAANEAKGFGTTNDAEDAALKIYGIEFERGETTAIDASLNDNGQRTNDSWYTIEGKKLNGEPTKKGIYIHKGKKVKK